MTLLPGLVVRNRIVMAPMTTWAGNDDGTVSDEEEAYYRRRAQDVGLVITGCTHVQENGVGFTGEFAAHVRIGHHAKGARWRRNTGYRSGVRRCHAARHHGWL
jgi:2,4-dienoyl-CoA reductase-like NADH-dependent reductase (Old Yellow Enzyme family)